MIKKVLIANRGEIALRVMRSCREMGLLTVAVFSDADRTSHHVAYADEAYPIGPAVAKESYLNIEKVIATAKRCGADAIHPGYGFLSENSEFARRCKEEGIIFIGPAAETMEAMGDKIAARKRMIAAGVPVVPGTEQPLQSAEEAVRICNEIGYPVMLKASMGGGGKGMRLIHNESEVVEAYNTARSESMSSFGDDTVYLEKFVEEPHHIEFQILGDNHGNVIHLFDRECSVQRRNQKVVEESPSPFLTPELRREMGEKAVAAAKAVNYSGAGTIVTVTMLLLIAGLNNTAYYPSSVDLQSSLTLQNSSSSEFTLSTMAVVSLLVPVVAAYIFYAWRALERKKLSLDDLNNDGHAY